MNREIKFRARAVQDGQWIVGDLIHKRHNGDEEVIIQEPNGCGTDCDINTIGQFTGLKDKNGREIFEGDIVKTAFSTEAFGVVTWNDEYGYFFIDVSFGRVTRVHGEHATLGRMLRALIGGKPTGIEVIGNVHG